MRLGARLLASLLIVTLYLPVGVAQADAGDQIVLTPLASSETAGVADTTVTVTALTTGVTDTNYTGTVTFTTGDGNATLPTPYQFQPGDAGVHVFTVTFGTAGLQTLTVTDDGSLTDSSSTDVSAGAPATVLLSGSTADLASGDTRDFTATVADAFANPVPNQVVTFSKSGGTGSVDFPTSPTTDGSGSATDTVTGDATGTVSITATAGSAGDVIGPFNVVFGALDHVTLAPKTGSISPGGSQPYTTTAFDVSGNTQNVSLSTVLSILPNGSCSAGSCSASISGAHTVTSTFGGQSDTATLTVGNNPPTAVNDTATVDENSGSNAVDVLANDTDPDPDTLTVTSVSNPPHGAATVDVGNLGVHYTPDANYSGTDSFTYDISDGHGGTDSATVNVTVDFVNLAPSFTKGADKGVNENAGAQTVSNWATAISPGPGNGDVGQALNFIVTNDNNALFSVQPAISASGTLTFTPALNTSGSATVSVQIHDNGGTTNGGVDTSAIQTFTITVSLVNHAPSFTGGGNDTLLEDAPAHTDLGWASSIVKGPANESGQVLDFIVTNDNNALFSVQPAVDATTGDLTYALAANANGLATVTVKLHDNGGTANGGSDTSAPQTMTITVTAVNDAPSFTSGGDKTVNENAGAQSFTGWATAISDGPLESGQTLNFIVTNDANALFSVQPAVSPTGTLTFTPVANRNGSATVSVKLHDNGGVLNSGVDTSAIQTFVITVTHVNQAPSFTKGADQAVFENSSAQIVAGWATALSPGADPTESGQALNFIVSNDTNAMFSVQPAISPAGVLTYTPATNVNGTAIVSVQIHDDGGVLNGGVDTSAVQTFTITLTLVNQAPTFTKGGDVTVFEDAAPQAIPGWATAITPGPGDPTQVLNFIVTNGNNPLFSSQPAVNALGALTFTTAPNKNGSAMVTISLHDNGGTANGGTDTSATQTFVINVTAVNDAPTFTKGADISLPEEASPVTHTVTNWATNFVPGPTDELSQTVLGYTVTNNANNLFSTQPTINTGGTLSYRLAANRNGTATVSVSVRDSGGTANGGVDTSSIQTFTITITGVDHAPAAITDSVTVIQGTGPNSIDALANDFDPDGDTITIIAVSQGAHGTTKIAADKLSVTYDPTGSYFGSDQFQYEITDGRLTAFGTVVVTVQKDTFAPVAAAPKIVTTATTGSTATIKIRWSGTDVGFGVKYYQLQESRNGGTYVSVTVPVGATSISRTVADGSTYRYRVRGVDQVGNVGTYVLSALYKPSEAPRSGPTNRTKA